MRLALVATHHAEYAANLAWVLAATDDVLLVLSTRNARRQLLPETLQRLRTRLQVRLVPHHYAPLQPLVALLCHRHVRRFGAGLVHVQEHPTRAMAWLARRLGGRVPLVTTVHDPQPHSGADAAAARPFVRHNATLRAASDRLIVHGATLVSALAATQHDGARRIRAMPHGILRAGVLAEGAPPSGPAGHGLILFGRMNAYKGLDLLLAAAARWRGRVPVTVAGSGPALDRLAPALRAAGVTVHAGRLSQPRLAALVRRHAGAVLPYRDATGSGAAATALGLGRPVIATAVGALGSAVHDGDNGLLVPPGDRDALAAAGLALAGETALCARLTAGACASAAGPLGWGAIAAETRALYREVTLSHQHHENAREGG